MSEKIYSVNMLIALFTDFKEDGFRTLSESELKEALQSLVAAQQERAPDRLRDEAKLSERKTVHEWLNDAGIPSDEYGKPICLLRRLRIAIDMLPKNGGR